MRVLLDHLKPKIMMNWRFDASKVDLVHKQMCLARRLPTPREFTWEIRTNTSEFQNKMAFMIFDKAMRFTKEVYYNYNKVCASEFCI